MNFLKNLGKRKVYDEETILNTPENITVENTLSKILDKKVKVYTHGDLGGATSAAIVTTVFDNVDLEICSNTNINDKINSFVLLKKDYINYDILFIMDVSLNEGAAKTLEKLHERVPELKIVYLNHQECNLWFNKYSWAVVKHINEESGEKLDTPTVVLEYLEKNYDLNPNDSMRYLVEKSRLYTTWQWKSIGDMDSYKLNLLCHYGSMKVFIKNLVRKLENNLSILNSDDYETALDIEENYQEYKQSKKDDIILTKINHGDKCYKVGVIFAERYISQIADDLSHMHGLHCVIVVDSLRKMSFRAAAESDIDVLDVAKIFGGKGNKKSAGAEIPVDITNLLVQNLISEFQDLYYNNF